MGNSTYEMIFAGDTMIGGYAPLKAERQPPHWISYVSVEDVDAVVKAAAANGGKVVEAPYDIPGVGRTARIADPQGAELCPFTSVQGDPPDALAPRGGWCWNELHTSDPKEALAFYEKVLGFSHRSLAGPDGAYHIVSKGGVDRGGVTDMGGERPHWLPYVAVDARAREAAWRDDLRGSGGHPKRRSLRRSAGSDRRGARDPQAAADAEAGVRRREPALVRFSCLDSFSEWRRVAGAWRNEITGRPRGSPC